MFGRRFADLLLFCVTLTELVILFLLTPTFTITDWIYVLQHLIVLGIALTRPRPKVRDYSIVSSGGASIDPGTTLVAGSQADDAVSAIPLPFTFFYYGTAFNTVPAFAAATGTCAVTARSNPRCVC